MSDEGNDETVSRGPRLPTGRPAAHTVESLLSDKTFAEIHTRSQEYIQADAGLQHRPKMDAGICPKCGREKQGILDGEKDEPCYQCLTNEARKQEVW